MVKIYIVIAALFMCLSSQAQESANAPAKADTKAEAGAGETVQLSEQQVEEIQQDITDYMNEVSELTSLIAYSTPTQLKQLKRDLLGIDARWQIFNAMEQTDISTSPALMQMLAQYKEVYLAASDSITATQARCDAQSTFKNALTFITRCASTYEQLLDQAKKYSLVPATAAKLENVKAKEQLLMQQVSAKYAQATAAVNANPTLKGQLPILEQRYIAIQELSQKIQAAQYKSFIEKAKDYLMSLAAVTIILMFITMITARIAALKKAREMAKKYGNGLGGQEEIPTI